MSSLENKVAIVTGASRGIGRALVLALAKEGCHVAFNYSQSADAAQSLVEESQAFGVKVQAMCVDIRDYAKVKEWIDAVRQELGGLDILINNAGVIADKALMMMSPDDWDKVIDTNLTGMFNAARSCIIPFMKQKSGQIVNISSVSGVIGLPRQVNYSASKGGMNAFTKALAKEVGGFGIRVNAIAPGYIATEILAGFNEAQREAIVKSIPVGRMGTVEDVARTVLFLLGDTGRYITGQVIVVDGGLTLG